MIVWYSHLFKNFPQFIVTHTIKDLSIVNETESDGEVAQSCPTLCEPTDSSLPGSAVHWIFQAQYWSGLSFPSPVDLPNPGIKPGSPALQTDALPSEPPGKPPVKQK